MNKRMSRLLGLVLVALGVGTAGFAEPLVKPGAHVAVVGDSITEQKNYSRFIELYLTVCQPQLDARVFQFGWSGERVPGFAARMDEDFKVFKPDVVTLCYGMNDGSYQKYTPEIGNAYEKSLRQVVEKIKAAGALAVVGGPGAVDTDFFRRNDLAPAVYNENLATLSGIAQRIAASNGFPHADVHNAMIEAMLKAKAVLGNGYDVCGKDGFHPNQDGHVIMAYAFLKAMGFDGDLGVITLDLKGQAGSAAGGHEVKSFADGKAEVESRRYPFCFVGDETSSDSTRSILPFLPFNADLNRLTLVVRQAESPKVKVTWGGTSKVFDRETLEKGVNLAAEFIPNPFNDAFARVNAAVAAKQAFETDLIKTALRTLRGVNTILGGDAEAIAAGQVLGKKLLEHEAQLDAQVRAAFQPVRHTIMIEAAP